MTKINILDYCPNYSVVDLELDQRMIYEDAKFEFTKYYPFPENDSYISEWKNQLIAYAKAVSLEWLETQLKLIKDGKE